MGKRVHKFTPGTVELFDEHGNYLKNPTVDENGDLKESTHWGKGHQQFAKLRKFFAFMFGNEDAYNTKVSDSPFHNVQYTAAQANATAVPTAMFHGLGDACTNPGMESIDKMLAQGTGATVKCIEVDTIGGGEVLGNFEHIAEEGCKKIAADPTFNGEFNVIGLSQGGLLARYIVEECEMPGKVRNMVTMGGPHMGTDAIPHCFSGFICNGINAIAKKFVYASWAQDWIGPAGYFRDINNYAGYLKGSVFLPKVNNEDSTQRESKFGALRTTRMSSLNSAYLGMFTKDTMIYPKETAWFQSVNENGQVVPLQDSEFWKKDFVGLAALNATGKVTFGSFVGEHLQFSRADITDKIIPALKQ